MTIEQLRKVHLARPFKPFRLHLADGRSIHVKHPEFLMQTPSGRTIYVATPKDDVEIIDLLLVTSIHIANNKRSPRQSSSN